MACEAAWAMLSVVQGQPRPSRSGTVKTLTPSTSTAALSLPSNELVRAQNLSFSPL